MRVTADVAAGLGYLAGAAAAGGAEFVLLRYRSRISRDFVDRTVGAARQTTGWRKRVYGPWNDYRFDADDARRNQVAFWVWVPAAVFLTLLTLVLFASAVAEFLR